MENSFATNSSSHRIQLGMISQSYVFSIPGIFLSYYQRSNVLTPVSNREDRATTLRMGLVKTASQHLFVILNPSQLDQYNSSVHRVVIVGLADHGHVLYLHTIHCQIQTTNIL
jgi:hypothetical protein